MTPQAWIGTGAASAMISVGAGAFAAHALKSRLPENLLSAFQTGAQYQMFHALALILFGLYTAWNPETLSFPGWAFLAGTLLFSGSLYVMATTGIRGIGMITPMGGLLFIVGWAVFAWTAFRK